MGERSAGELRTVRAGAGRRCVLTAEDRRLSLYGVRGERVLRVRTGGRVEEGVEGVGARG